VYSRQYSQRADVVGTIENLVIEPFSFVMWSSVIEQQPAHRRRVVLACVTILNIIRYTVAQMFTYPRLASESGSGTGPTPHRDTPIFPFGLVNGYQPVPRSAATASLPSRSEHAQSVRSTHDKSAQLVVVGGDVNQIEGVPHQNGMPEPSGSTASKTLWIGVGSAVLIMIGIVTTVLILLSRSSAGNRAASEAHPTKQAGHGQADEGIVDDHLSHPALGTVEESVRMEDGAAAETAYNEDAETAVIARADQYRAFMSQVAEVYKQEQLRLQERMSSTNTNATT
jgi:hypothetical protein